MICKQSGEIVIFTTCSAIFGGNRIFRPKVLYDLITVHLLVLYLWFQTKAFYVFNFKIIGKTYKKKRLRKTRIKEGNSTGVTQL